MESDIKHAVLASLLPLVAVVALVIQFKSIPGPPYGGDLYFHAGIAEAIRWGTLPWRDPTNLNGYAFYPWLYHLSVAVISALFHLDVEEVTTYVMPPAIILLSSLLSYWIGTEITDSRRASFLIALTPLALAFPEAHPHTLFELVFMPLFLLLLLRYLRSPTDRNGFFLGLSWGLCGLTYVIGTFAPGAILLINLVVDAVKSRKVALRWTLPIFTGILFLLPYWAPLFVFYHAETLNPYQSLVMAHYTLLKFTISTATFFLSLEPFKLATTLLALLGFYALFKLSRSTELRLLASSLTAIYLAGIFFFAVNDRLVAYKSDLLTLLSF